MKVNHKILTPLYILLVIFTVDKIFLIPAVQECCLRESYDFFYQESHDNAFHQENLYNSSKASGHKILLNFGSSMSYGYYYIQPGTPAFEDLRPGSQYENTTDPSAWRIINFAYPGASMLTTYIRLNQILDRGIKPDLVSIEFAPTAFNHRAPWYKSELAHAMPASFFWKHIHEIPLKHTSIILMGKAFVLYHKKIGRPDPMNNVMDDFFTKFLKGRENSYDDLPDYLTKSYRPGEEGHYHKVLELGAIDNLKNGLRDFEPSSEHSEYFRLVLDRLHDSNIPVILWYPKIHPGVYNAVTNPEQAEAMQPLLDQLNQNDRYINMNSDSSCNSYIDPIHMSLACYKELFLQKMALYPN